MIIKYYIAKSHVPKTCVMCNEVAAPWQSKVRCFAGSYLWNRGYHTLCQLKATYAPFCHDIILDNNPLLKMIPKDLSFQGACYHLPVTVTK